MVILHLGANDLSVQTWSFLLTHLAWASGFMFLISWRGYWQELIDIILYMHLKTPILINLWNGDIYTPLALSIVQARFIGLVHFSTGLFYFGISRPGLRPGPNWADWSSEAAK